ncbi:MAG: L-serine ammonia-lyase, iron-sulfur-dependent, subunit alpha [Candidatus Aminicenantes bacterium]|nr:L-serine ammonia-lyase, iron-sulfur-dependent, subunit alpha [Candidatus Aminicenantes bacterium]
MDFPSILNDVLGPVMRGPSSSHTAGSYHIARIIRDLAEGIPVSALFRFDPKGSYAHTFRQQGADNAFAAGLLALEMEDKHFLRALDEASSQGLKIHFEVSPLRQAIHPNTVDIVLTTQKKEKLHFTAASTGGGRFEITEYQGIPVELRGQSYVLLAEIPAKANPCMNNLVSSKTYKSKVFPFGQQKNLFQVKSPVPFPEELLQNIKNIPGKGKVRLSFPVFFPHKGEKTGGIKHNFSQWMRTSSVSDLSLGERALQYEANILGLSPENILKELEKRYEIMRSSVKNGFDDTKSRMQMISPFAGKLLLTSQMGSLPFGGLPTRASARALAALHTSCSGGVICAAPTGASAGVLPGVLVTLEEEMNKNRLIILNSLLAAGAVGLIVAERATFAAEVAGCQVEIGAAGAMAAAAVVEGFGGTSLQAADAAAVFFQNIMGSVCDLVQGICEIPCHTRNASAASSAFLCADLIIGGYTNPVPLEETVDAVFAVGKMLPSELRCTSRGGLALCPSSLGLSSRKPH